MKIPIIAMLQFNMLKNHETAPDYILPELQKINVIRGGFAFGLAAITLGQALQNGNGGFTYPAVIWLTISLPCLGYGLFTSQKPWSGTLMKISEPLLILGLIWQIIELATTIPGVSHSASFFSSFWLFKLCMAGTGVLALLSLAPARWITPSWRNLLVCLSLMAIGLLGVWIIKSSPKPRIDVFVFQQTSARALLNGRNPYTLNAPNIYSDSRYYGEKLIGSDGKLTIGNPYPPLSIYISTLGYLAGGDIRYSSLFALVLSGVFIAFLHPGRETKLAAFIYIFTPRVFYVIEQGWTEPIVILVLTATVYIAIHHSRWLPFMFGLLFSIKQYLLFLIPLIFLLIPQKFTLKDKTRFFIIIAGVAFVVTAPLALWDIHAFIWNVGEAQWYQIFRMDALSYLALYARIFNRTPSQLISFIALAIAFSPVWRFTPRTPTGFIGGAAWCFGIFLAFNKQAFCNYYFLIIGAICCALSSLYLDHQDENSLQD